MAATLKPQRATQYTWLQRILHLTSTGPMAASRVHVKSLVHRGRDIFGVSPFSHIQSVLGACRLMGEQTEDVTAETALCLKLCTSWRLQVLMAPGSHSGYMV